MSKKKKRRECGQAVVEFALVVPLLLTILCGILDFGWLYYNKYQVEDATYQGTRYVTIVSGQGKSNDDIKTEAEAEVKKNLPKSIQNPNVNVEVVGDKVTVKTTGKIKTLTFVASTIFGSYYEAKSTNVTAK